MNNNTTSFTFENFLNFTKQMNQKIDQQNNPNGEDKIVVRLDNFLPGEIKILRQFVPGTKPVEVKKMIFKEGQNRLSIDKDFRGVVAGLSKDSSKFKLYFTFACFFSSVKRFFANNKLLSSKLNFLFIVFILSFSK